MESDKNAGGPPINNDMYNIILVLMQVTSGTLLFN